MKGGEIALPTCVHCHVAKSKQGIRRLKGRSLSLTPLYLKCEHRIVGLIFLLSIALRVLVLMQFVARENWKKAGTTLKGIYPGQPGRQTARPTTEMMLHVFRGITWSRITSSSREVRGGMGYQ